VICIVISFLLCFYLKLKRKNRRFDDNYEYTRLHNSAFGLGINTESKCRHEYLFIYLFSFLVTDTSLITNEMMDDEPEFDSNGHYRSSEYRRLLHVDS
jgi:hypothetical protein